MLKMRANWFQNYVFDTKVCAKLAVRSLVIWLSAMTLVASFSSTAHAKSWFSKDTETTISVTELPKQGQIVYALIAQGGPYAYDKDGVIFGNREQLLPKHRRGYYREYTVKTPGTRSRGARRIVCGGLQVQTPDICYYTEDHYSSFRKIVQ